MSLEIGNYFCEFCILGSTALIGKDTRTQDTNHKQISIIKTQYSKCWWWFCDIKERFLH